MFPKKLDFFCVLGYNFNRTFYSKGSTWVEKKRIVKKTANAPARPKRKWDPELILSVFLLIFIVLAIALTALLVIGYVSDTPTDPNGGGNGGASGDEGELPVFSDGVYPAIPSVSGDSVAVNALNSEYAALVDPESGKVLAHKNGDARFHPASMTKIMTLIVACEQLTEEDLERKVTLTEDLLDFVTSGIYAGTSRSYFDVDDKVRIKDLLYGIGVVSAADCTLMTVQAVFPSSSPKRAEEKFVVLMNEKAEEMGLKNTHFENSVGVEGEEHYTTACEMAAILSYALECPLIDDILSRDTAYEFYVKYNKDGEEKNYKMTHYSTLFNTNSKRSSRFRAYAEKEKKEFALSTLAFCGGKTGTLGSGTTSDPYVRSLASYAQAEGGKRYVLITGNTTLSYGMLVDAKTMYDTYAK